MNTTLSPKDAAALEQYVERSAWRGLDPVEARAEGIALIDAAKALKVNLPDARLTGDRDE